MAPSIESALARLDAWIEGQQFKGWDPYDTLNSALVRQLTFGQRRLGQAWIQIFKRSPVNLRRALGIRPDYNPKGMGLFLASYGRKYELTREPRHRGHVEFFARWL